MSFEPLHKNMSNLITMDKSMNNGECVPPMGILFLKKYHEMIKSRKKN
jgi:hypothetical protein